MDRTKLFELAIENYNGSLSTVKPSAFRAIENILKSILVMQESEEEKLKDIKAMFSKIKASKSKTLMGCQRSELCGILNECVNIEGDAKLQKLSVADLVYYYCTLERMYNSKADFSQEKNELIKRRQEEKQRIIEAEREKKNKEKEEKERREQEEKERLESMTPVQKEIYILKNNATDETATKLYNQLDSFDDEAKKEVAVALKEYYNEKSKLDGKGISKKQKQKNEKIRKILGE